MTLGAVLLAAGAGLRMGGAGGRPKALLELDGVSLIERQLIALSGAGVDELVVVLGHHAGLIEPVIQVFPLTLVHNPRPEEGQVSSQRLGLQALSSTPDAVLVALADQPLITEQDILTLVGAFNNRREGTSVVYPLVDGEPGNPVIFSAAVRDQILAGDAGFGCREWRDANPDAASPLVTDNRRFKVDIDTLQDIERFERETGHALRWPAALATAG